MDIKVGDIVYYARILRDTDVYDVIDLNIRTAEDTWCVGTEKTTKHAYMFSEKDVGRIVFRDREDALCVVKEAEKNRKIVSKETLYEEY